MSVIYLVSLCFRKLQNNYVIPLSMIAAAVAIYSINKVVGFQDISTSKGRRLSRKPELQQSMYFL